MILAAGWLAGGDLAAAWQAPVAEPSKPPAEAQDYTVYNDHPRLLLTGARLRLLKRQKERDQPTWLQLAALIKGRAAVPEPGFLYALYHQVAEDEAAGRQAIAFALSGDADLRQQALVFDWCQALLTPAQNKQLAGRLAKALAGRPAPDVASQRSRALAAIALSGHGDEKVVREALTQVVEQWWRGSVAPALKSGKRVFSRPELYPLFEMLHAVRDAYEIDLREDAAVYFKDLASSLLLTYYPAVFPAAENEYHIPIFSGSEPDLREAAFARIAELAAVAYDTNARDSQFLQGWVRNDRFVLKGALGAPYEFLWSNPYQPGLSYFYLPLYYHDRRTGRLFLRSSWDEDATWLGYFDKKLELFTDGRIQPLAMKNRPEGVLVGEARVYQSKAPFEFVQAPDGAPVVFIMGLEPNTRYDLEIDDEELNEAETDAGGILALELRRTAAVAVRVRPLGAGPPLP